MTIRESLRHATQRLMTMSDNPSLDAEILLAYVLNKPRSYLHAWPETMLTPQQVGLYAELIYRRLNKEPVAYITGQREFWSLNFRVTQDTLIPRPETELLVETLLARLPQGEHLKVADLGTGCGTIALTLAHERPKWQIYATDISESAMTVAKQNAAQLQLDHIEFLSGHWCQALPHIQLDAIVSNPPYISEQEWEIYGPELGFEPYNALVAGDDGLQSIMEICQAAPVYLQPGGHLLIEHGFLQGPKVRDIFMGEHYTEIQTLTDLSGRDRATIGRVAS